MSIYSKLAQHREELMAIAARHGARNVRVFGSVARGDADVGSDLHLLIDLEPGRTLLDIGGLVYEASALLGCEVDVVTYGALRGRFRQRVLDEARPLEELVA